jgi:2-dehydro-3-deoxygluconokinase
MLRAHYLRAGSAGSELGPSDLDGLNLADFAAVHLTGITPALSTTAGAAWERLIDRAATAGVPVVLDVNHRSALWSQADARDRLLGHLAKVGVLLAGDDEAALLLNVPTTLVRADPLRYAKELLALVAPGGEVVLKLGRDGSVHLAADGTPTHGEALTVPVIDPVGAGDAFAAGWIAGWLNEIGPEDTLRRAHATAAFVVASPGDWEGLPSAAELPAAMALTDEDVQR